MQQRQSLISSCMSKLRRAVRVRNPQIERIAQNYSVLNLAIVVAQAMTENQRSSKQATRPVRQKVAKSNAAVPSRLAREAKANSKLVSDDNSNSMPYSQSTATKGSQQSNGLSAEDLVAMLKRPGGVQQAILLREILDRPEHRW